MRARLRCTFMCSTLLILAIISFSHAANSAEWATRTIYQVLTDRFASPTNSPCPFVPPFSLPLNVYCGGTWAALASRLDYIRGMGFDAIWISPIVDQIQFDVSAGFQGMIQSCVPAHDIQCVSHASTDSLLAFFRYHGFWMRRLFELNARFGTCLLYTSDAADERIV